MGGTTAKASLIEDGAISRGREYEVGGSISAGSRLIRGAGELLRIPTIDIAEVGAGGGSIAWLDPAGGLQVGPRSAGADAGPGLLRARRRRADGDRRERRARLHARRARSRTGRSRSPPSSPRQAVRRVAEPLGLDAARGGERDPPDRERADDARAARGLVREGARPARLRADRLRRRRAGPRRRARRGSRRCGPCSCRRWRASSAPSACSSRGRSSTRCAPAIWTSTRSTRRGRGALRRDGGRARRARSRARRGRVGADGRPPLRRPELGDRGRLPGRRDRRRRPRGAATRFEDEHERLYGVARPAGLAGRDPGAAARGARRGGRRRAAFERRRRGRRGRREPAGSDVGDGGVDAPVRLARRSATRRARAAARRRVRHDGRRPARLDRSGVDAATGTLVLERDAMATSRPRVDPVDAADRRRTRSRRSPTRWRRRSSAPRTRPSSATGWTSRPRSATPSGETVAQAVSVPFHLGSIPTAMETLLEHYGERDPARATSSSMNDPFDGGMHLQDIFVVKPVHLDGDADRLRRARPRTTATSAAGCRARAPATTRRSSRRGIRLPWLRLYAEGEPVEDVFKIIEANVRIPRDDVRRPRGAGRGVLGRRARAVRRSPSGTARRRSPS